MAVTFSCDKCGNRVDSIDDLFRVVVRRTKSRTPIDGTDSKLDLCAKCTDRIMREANEDDPRCAND